MKHNAFSFLLSFFWKRSVAKYPRPLRVSLSVPHVLKLVHTLKQNCKIFSLHYFFYSLVACARDFFFGFYLHEWF